MMLTEVSKLDDQFFSPLEDAVQESEFWFGDNGVNDSDVNSVDGSWVQQTPAAEMLGNALQAFFDELMFPITVAVSSIDPVEVPEAVIGKDHIVYPNGIVVSGQMAVSSRGRFVLNLLVGMFAKDFDVGDIDPISISTKTARLIRHELVHSTQLEKRRRKGRISRTAAAKKYTEEGETPPTDDRKKYLSAKIEVDAYAHEIAEEFLSKLGLNDALDVLRGHISVENLDLSDQIKEYLVDFADEPFTRRMKKKVYTHIIDLVRRGIY